MIAPAGTLASIPEGLSATEAAPLMCAGVTTFNALRNSGARPGDLVAILGVGGLGHLGVQYAAKMGFNTVAIARGGDREQMARRLGAGHYIDNEKLDPAAELLKLGGARVILATAMDAGAMSAALGGLGVNGNLVILGVTAEPLQVPGIPMIMARQTITGWPSGTSIDSQDALSFSLLTGVRAMTQAFPLERASEAYDSMISGKVRFRAVIRFEH
jgi:D-arabinose 1-dehydrogenase-like Zn-dependent alcohol dehydrogenase